MSFQDSATSAQIQPGLGLRPFLRAVQNAKDVDGVTGDSINDDVRQGCKHQFPGSLLLAGTPEMGKFQESDGGTVDGAHQFGRMVRRFPK